MQIKSLRIKSYRSGPIHDTASVPAKTPLGLSSATKGRNRCCYDVNFTPATAGKLSYLLGVIISL